MFDRVGNEIHEGAIVRWFHFRTPRRKHYMYKQIGKVRGKKTYVYHLPIPLKATGKQTWFFISSYLDKDDKVMDCVVVSCDCEHHQHHDLKRSRELRD